MRVGVLLVSLLALARAVAQAHDSVTHAPDHSSLDVRMAALGAPPKAPALTPGGEVALAGSSAKGSEAKRIRVGDPAARLEGSARKIGKALFVRRAGPGARLVYGVRKGRVRFVAVGTRDATGSRKSLRRYLGLAKLR